MPCDTPWIILTSFLKGKEMYTSYTYMHKYWFRNPAQYPNHHPKWLRWHLIPNVNMSMRTLTDDLPVNTVKSNEIWKMKCTLQSCTQDKCANVCKHVGGETKANLSTSHSWRHFACTADEGFLSKTSSFSGNLMYILFFFVISIVITDVHLINNT